MRKKTLVTIPIAVLLIGALAISLSTILPLVASAPQVKSGNYKIGPKDPFEIEFDQWMNRDSVQKNISIFPSIPFEIGWRGNRLQLSTKEEKTVGNHYMVFINKKTRNCMGKELEEAKSLDYQIIDSPAVMHTYPSQIQDQYEKIYVTYTEDMTDTIESTPKKQPIITPNISGLWKWITPATLQFTPNTAWKNSTQYEIVIPSGIKSIRGAGTEQEYKFTVETQRIETESIEDWHGKHNEPIAVRFNQAVEIKNIKNYITIWQGRMRLEQIEATYAPDENNVDEAKIFIIPADGWKFDQTYTIEIQKGILAKNGNLVTQREIETTFHTDRKISITGADGKNSFFGKTFKAIVQSDYEMNPLELKNNSDTEPSLEIQATYMKDDQGNPDKKRVMLIAEAPYEQNIKFTINKNIRFENGDKYLSQNIETTFAKTQPYEILDISTETNEGHNTICIYTNNLGDKDLYTKNTDISPHAEIVKIQSGFVEKNSLCYKEKFIDNAYTAITANLSPTSHYLITLGENLEDIFEQKLGKEYQKEILTSQMPSKEKNIVFTENTYLEYENIEDITIPILSLNNEKIVIETCQLKETALVELEVKNNINEIALSSSPCANYSIQQKIIENPYWKEIGFDIKAKDFFESKQDRQITLMRISGDNNKDRSTYVLLPSGIRTIVKQAPHELLVWTTDKKSNEPVKDAMIQGYTKEGHRIMAGKTDGDGILYVNQTEMIAYVTIKKDDQISFVNAFWDSDQTIIQEESEYYLITALDKEVYQKEDTIRFKIFLRKNDDALFSAAEQKFVSISIRNSEGIEVLKKTYLTNTNGSFADSFTLNNPPEGNYTLISCVGKSQDYCEEGESYTRFVVGSGEEYTKQDDNTIEQQNPENNLESDKQLYHHGETAKFQFDSQTNTKALISVERKRIKYFEIRDVQKGKNTFNIEIDESLIPNAFVTVFMINGETATVLQKEITIEKPYKDLSIKGEVTENSENENEIKIDITISDTNGNPVMADMIVALKYQGDESTHFTERVIENLYHRRDPGIKTIRNNTSTLKEGNYENTDSEKVSFTLPAIFTNTKTIQWITNISSNEFGKVSASLPMVENNDNYEVFIFAMDERTRMGEEKIRISTSPEMVITKSLPTHLRSGDITHLLYSIENTTEKEKYIRASLETKFLNIAGKNELAVTIPAKQSAQIKFETTAPQIPYSTNDTIKFLVQGDTQTINDTQIITITANATEQTERIIGNLEKQRETIIIDNNDNVDLKLKVSTAATFLAYIADDIEYLLSYQHPNNDDLIGRLGVIADIIQKTSVSSFENLGFPNLRNKDGEDIVFKDVVKNILEKISSLQNTDGGWSTWGKDENKSNIITTANILDSLHSLKKAGFTISATVYNNAFNFVTQGLYGLNQENDFALQAFLISKLSGIGRHETGFIEKIYNNKEKLNTDSKIYLANALYQAGFVTRAKEIIHSVLQNSFRSHKGLRIFATQDKSESIQMNNISRTAFLLRIMHELDLIENNEDLMWILTAPDHLLSATDRSELIKTIAAFIPSSGNEEQIIEGSIDINKNKREKIYWDKNNFFQITKMNSTLSGLSSSIRHYINIEKKGGTIFYEIIKSYVPNIKNVHAVSEGIGIYRSAPQIIRQGEIAETILTIIIPKTTYGIAIEEPIPAGFKFQYVDDNDIFSFENIRNDHFYLYADVLEKGVYNIRIRSIAENAGKFHYPQTKIYRTNDYGTFGATNYDFVTITEK